MNTYLMVHEVCRETVLPPYRYDIHPTNDTSYITLVIACGADAAVMGFRYSRQDCRVSVTSSVPLMNNLNGHMSDYSMTPAKFTRQWIELAIYLLSRTND